MGSGKREVAVRKYPVDVVTALALNVKSVGVKVPIFAPTLRNKFCSCGGIGIRASLRNWSRKG